MPSSTRSTRACANSMNAEFLAGLTLPRAYYKGTFLAFPTDKPDEFIKTVEQQAHLLITKELRRGNSLAQIKEWHKGDIDKMENRLCELQRSGKYPSTGTTETHLAWADEAGRGIWSEPGDIEPSGYATGNWFLTVAILLKLKVIENDEMNGWLMMKLNNL
jgi:hypothetical protein